FDPLTGRFHGDLGVAAIRRRQVDLVPGPLNHSHATFAAKALLSSIRFSFSLTPRLDHFVRRYLSAPTLSYEASKVFPDITHSFRSEVRRVGKDCFAHGSY